MPIKVLEDKVNTLIVKTSGINIKVFPSKDDRSVVNLPDSVSTIVDDQNIFFTEDEEEVRCRTLEVEGLANSNVTINRGNSSIDLPNMSGRLAINLFSNIIRSGCIGISLCKNKPFNLFLQSTNGNIGIEDINALLIKIEMENGGAILRRVTSQTLVTITESGNIDMSEVDGQNIIIGSQNGNVKASFADDVDEYKSEIVAIEGTKKIDQELNLNPNATKDIKLASYYGDVEVGFGPKK